VLRFMTKEGSRMVGEQGNKNDKVLFISIFQRAVSTQDFKY